MSALKRAREDEAAAGAATGGAGGPAPPPPQPPPLPPARRRPATRSVVATEALAYERRLKLTDVIGLVAQNGYAREANGCAGLCRETWRCIPPGLSAADADRVRRSHPLWQAIIDLPDDAHAFNLNTRMSKAVARDDLARVRELCDWQADIEAADEVGATPLWRASCCVGRTLPRGGCVRIAIVRELLARGADVNRVASQEGNMSVLMAACAHGCTEVVGALLAAGADKQYASHIGFAGPWPQTRGIVARDYAQDPAIVALLDATP